MENSVDRGAWQVVVHGVAKSLPRLSDRHFHFLRWNRTGWRLTVEWAPHPVRPFSTRLSNVRGCGFHLAHWGHEPFGAILCVDTWVGGRGVKGLLEVRVHHRRNKSITAKAFQALAWWSSCQCRGHGFDHGSGKTPHVVEQLGPSAASRE